MPIPMHWVASRWTWWLHCWTTKMSISPNLLSNIRAIQVPSIRWPSKIKIRFYLENNVSKFNTAQFLRTLALTISLALRQIYNCSTYICSWNLNVVLYCYKTISLFKCWNYLAITVVRLWNTYCPWTMRLKPVIIHQWTTTWNNGDTNRWAGVAVV